MSPRVDLSAAASTESRPPVAGLFSAEWARINHGTWRGFVRHELSWLELGLGRATPFLQGDVRRARRLVFVCLGNINRSAFADAVARQLGEASISIGLSTTTGAPATPEATHQASRQGIDLTSHLATSIADYGYTPGDLLFAMELRHARALAALGIPASAIGLLGLWATPQRVHLHDPHTLSADYFATCFTLIESAVHRVVHFRRSAPGA